MYKIEFNAGMNKSPELAQKKPHRPSSTNGIMTNMSRVQTQRQYLPQAVRRSTNYDDQNRHYNSVDVSLGLVSSSLRGTRKSTYGHHLVLRHTSFFRVEVLTILKPVSPPKVLGFQYSGEQMGFPIRPFSEKGAPISTILSPNRLLGRVFSSRMPG